MKNDILNQVRKFDPFEKVILVKGIDNSILTSFRTLKKENNIISDTFKVIHNKFQPLGQKNSFFMIMNKNHNEKGLYPLSDNEEDREMAENMVFNNNNFNIEIDYE